MTRPLPLATEAIFWSLATALGYFLLATLSLEATKGADNIAAVWPPSGYFLAMLLLMPARARPFAFAAAAAASLASNWWGGASLGLALAFTIANACEAAVALWVIERRESGDLSFMVPRAVASFAVATVAASLTSAGIATLMTGGTVDFLRSWLTTVALGIAIVTPPLVMLARLVRSRAMANTTLRMRVEAALLLTAAAMLTVFAFSQTAYPLTALPLVAVVFASFRLGPFGAASSILIVAAITSWLTGQGEGRFASLPGGDATTVLFLQFYLLVLLFTALPLAALIVSRQRLMDRLEQSNRLLLQAEEAALVGHWRVDVLDWTIQWSDQAYRIHGIEPGTAVGVENSADLYMPGDGARLRATVAEAVRKGTDFEFHGQIIRADDDEVRDIVSRGSVERSRTGRVVGIFGTIQDVTETVENARMLDAARRDAEAAANTDQLTGLPNRRHTLAFLTKALAASRGGGAPLAVAIFDIDHFKAINDRYGHSVGDSVIRRVGRRAKASLREEDMVGRYGGEEFVCVLPGASAHAAAAMVERVRQAIEADPEGAEDAPNVTVSIGLAVYAGEATIEDLLQRADQALYAAKRGGRNRLQVAA